MEIMNVFLSIGNNDIISDINWSIMPKERWALVGRNGAGTLFFRVNFVYIEESIYSSKPTNRKVNLTKSFDW